MAKAKDKTALLPVSFGRLWAGLFAAFVFASGIAGAAEDNKKAPAEPGAETLTFLGVKVTPYRGTYIVLKDVSIRSKPETGAKRLGSYKAGRRIQVVGLASGAWVAVREKGRDAGFVYSKVLLPLIDGTLARDLTGHITAQDGGKDKASETQCRYTISFEGKSAVEGEVFEIADYDVVWNCTRGKRQVKFRTPMFITEAPSQLSPQRIFQITVDVVDLDRGYDEVFSTFLLFNMEKGEVVFDGVSIDKYGSPPAVRRAPAQTLEEALKASLGIVLRTWNDATWKELIKNMPVYTDSKPKKKAPEDKEK